jgi:hypothetical protein
MSKNNNNEHDIDENNLDIFLKLKIDGNFLTDQEILNDMNLSTLALHDTLKSAISLIIIASQSIQKCNKKFPPVCFFARKLSSEVTAGDFTFPKDVEVIFSPFLMGRNPKYFADPLKFDPNRVLELKSDPSGFIPFALAPRKCLGMKIAYVIMKIAIVGVLKNFKLSLPKESEELKLNVDMTLSAKNGIKLNFEPRC